MVFFIKSKDLSYTSNEVLSWYISCCWKIHVYGRFLGQTLWRCYRWFTYETAFKMASYAVAESWL